MVGCGETAVSAGESGAVSCLVLYSQVKAHFRKGWRDIQTLTDQKYADMSKAFSLISVDGNTNPLLCHANDEWIKKKLPKSDPVRNELSAPSTKPGRNAMTLVPFYECLFDVNLLQFMFQSTFDPMGNQHANCNSLFDRL